MDADDQAAKSKHELSQTGVPMGSGYSGIDLALVRKQAKHGKELWVKELELAKGGTKGMPSRDLYAEFISNFNLRAETTSENIRRIAAALDAAYCHLAQTTPSSRSTGD